VSYTNTISLSSELHEAHLTESELAELCKLREKRIPSLLIPRQGETTKFAKCHYFNVLFRGVQGLVNVTRDCHIACDFHFGRKMLRCYGQIQFFVSAICGAEGNLRLYLAYVEWYKLEPHKDTDDVNVVSVTMSPSSDPALQRFVPVGDIVCKVALLPWTKTKASVLELL